MSKKTKEEINKESADKLGFLNSTKNQDRIKNEFKKSLDVDDKHFQAEYVRIQGKEILDYIFRLKMSPLKAWESFIKDSINRNKAVFLYDFYLKENEFGEFELDEERIETLIMQDDPEDD